MTDQIELYEENGLHNPLDYVEDVLNDHNWVYSRMNDEKLIVEVAGNACHYRLLFVWQEHMNALQLSCQYELSIKPEHVPLAATALLDMNASLWMGHFELTKEERAPCFRQTCLLRGHAKKSGYEHIEDLVDISLSQCERFQPVFHMLSKNENIDSEILSFAMMETAGES